MGYTTDFEGSFSFDKPLDSETLSFLQKFNETRRMKRKLSKEYGVEGEFYVDGTGEFGQGREDNVIDHNSPPRTQPGLWCQWRPTDDGEELEWDGGEKFYNYVEWLQYLIKNFIAPKGYKLNGSVRWRGEEFSDIGTIFITDNKVEVISGKYADKLPKKKGKANVR